ncbi:hypothetical protein [uncultured Pseudodesulfovibrio sp.]|uniref:hypothetical protein n=1 Tax=uncultured Pseudodesulfovibrio sp. TaxID=2035858 RepID=UPI0029C6ED52|nr:hypothetical protein [uncultured Pseudodesulfovibrio sp.]
MKKSPAMDDKTKPYFTEDGTLVIPFECSDHSYKYWKQEGKEMREILEELGVDETVWAKYTHEKYPENGDGTSEE